MFRRQILATGSGKLAPKLTFAECGVVCTYHGWRFGVANGLQRHFGSLKHYALMEALLLGSQSLVNAETQDLLRWTGTSHLLAISGLHVGLVAGLALWLLKPLLLRLTRQHASPRQQRLLLFSSVFLLTAFFSLLAGFSVPTRRALIMLGVAGVMLARGRSVSWFSIWLAALFCVLLVDPLAPLDAGFWLSFMAVALLSLAFAGRVVRPGALSGLLVAQVAITAGFWVLMGSTGIVSSLASLPANILAIPWVSLVVMPTLLLGAPLLMGLSCFGADALAERLSSLLNLPLDLLVRYLQLFGAWPQINLYDAGPLLVVSGVAICLSLFPLGALFRLLAVSMSALLLLWAMVAPRTNESVPVPEVWVLDVGQGLAVLIRSGDQVMLYDTGPGWMDGGSALELILPAVMRSLGIRRLDLVILSHGDKDHSGGVEWLRRTGQVTQWIAGDTERVIRFLPEMHACPTGETLPFGDVSLHFWMAERAENSNDRSCVVRVDYPGGRLLLPGDIGRKVEWLLMRSTLAKDIDLLVAAHHGSRNSSMEAFVAQARPRWVIYTAGYRNRFGHPHPEVDQRFARMGAIRLNTATQGAVHIRLVEAPLQVDWLRKNPPFWVKPSTMLQ